jgi:hypothetical protein
VIRGDHSWRVAIRQNAGLEEARRVRDHLLAAMLTNIVSRVDLDGIDQRGDAVGHWLSVEASGMRGDRVPGTRAGPNRGESVCVSDVTGVQNPWRALKMSPSNLDHSKDDHDRLQPLF